MPLSPGGTGWRAAAGAWPSACISAPMLLAASCALRGFACLAAFGLPLPAHTGLQPDPKQAMGPRREREAMACAAGAAAAGLKPRSPRDVGAPVAGAGTIYYH
eukprot:scaffold12962_cov135-Isochrysis_galbana.AAC.8